MAETPDTGDGVEVDTERLRTFGKWLTDRGADLKQPMADVDVIKVSPGDGGIIPNAATLFATVDARRTALKDNLTKHQTGLDKMGGNAIRAGDMYDKTEDENKAEAEGLMPLMTHDDGFDTPKD